MTWVPVESKVLLSVAFDHSRNILYLRFRSGEVYRYFEFSKSDYDFFLAAESKGSHFANHIRNCFPYERLAKLTVAAAN